MSTPIAVLAVESEMQYFEPGDKTGIEGVDWILNNMNVDTFAEDAENPPTPVGVAVVASPDGTVYDVLLNALSIGYHPMLALVMSNPGLKMPELLACGREDDIDLEALCVDADYRIYPLPLFGEAADVA